MNQRSMGWLVVGAVVALALLVLNVALTLRNTRQLNDHAYWVAHTHEVIAGLETVLSLAKDAETGQRGYVITGEPQYLKPYNAAVAAIHQQVDRLQRLTADNPRQQARFPELRARIAAKLRELDQTVALRQRDGFDAARRVVMTDRGKREMDALRAIVGAMTRDEQTLLRDRSRQAGQTYRAALFTGSVSGLAALAAVWIMPVTDDEGRVVRWFGTNTDISEAKRTEEELREARSRLESTLAAGDVGTWELDVVRNIVRADENLARMFGLTPDERAGGPVEAYLRQSIRTTGTGWWQSSGRHWRRATPSGRAMKSWYW